MVSHQLVYVTGMLEVILTPSDPSGGCGRLRSFPGTRRTWSASLTPLPRPRKPSNNLFEPFRPLGNLQTTCLSLSDPSETFKQLVWAFPTPRKPSNNLFGPFRPLGAAAAACEVFSWYPAILAGVPDAFRPLGRHSNEWRKSASTCAPLPPLGISLIFTPT